MYIGLDSRALTLDKIIRYTHFCSYVCQKTENEKMKKIECWPAPTNQND